MDEDKEVLLKALSSFALYRPSLHSANQLRRTDYISLSETHKSLLPDYLQKLEEADDAIELNSDLVEAMLFTGSEALLGEKWSKAMSVTPGSGDLEKVRAAVKQVVRDWSSEGAEERRLTYSPLLDLLQREYSGLPPEERSSVSVLTPGCGLARLSFEVARLGFDSVGNEFSYHMLIASNYLLNCTTKVGQHEFSPFVHSFSNHQRHEDMIRRISIPDVVPSDVLQDASFSMATGEFIESFGSAQSASSFDCIITSFFLDTAHNIIDYLDTIRNLLKDGGFWINVGPCLWHHEHGQNRHGKSAFDEDGTYAGSIELSMEEIMTLIGKMGFIVDHEESVSTPYMGNTRGMLEHTYHARLFTAHLRKS
ncbi:UPF0586 protein C1778.07 [Taphrina deformans PYCC 5710]|uniref:carnosine N-methyltransferase n=1 Tax=Taphrina deformans (strain PYCC 5710 / ATCC 11124 / CBS 356.35 / IMI 108563 / JCM 9778 / NBRC 8474) TaxID=1097556 RepID=R4XDT6_TAPDE|nr:UPF0586 protein C1778.07 [Taphrina deformans PYCC 5710]|eukprot:CCG81499.1 UPF0586 protein C1778.07 [Taphrina deformans PYCC 5710]